MCLSAQATLHQADFAALAQHLVGAATGCYRCRVDDRQLGEVDRSDAEVVAWVEHTACGELGGGAEQSMDVPAPVRNFVSDLDHLGRGLQVRLASAFVEVPGVERDEAARGIEHIGDHGVLRSGIAHRVAQHRRHVVVVGKTEEPRGTDG